jgi:hypothetical protein
VVVEGVLAAASQSVMVEVVVLDGVVVAAVIAGVVAAKIFQPTNRVTRQIEGTVEYSAFVPLVLQYAEYVYHCTLLNSY